MDWRLWHYAKDKGVKCVINCDAHRNEHARFLRLGAGIARKGWLEKGRDQHAAAQEAAPGTGAQTGAVRPTISIP